MCGTLELASGFGRPASFVRRFVFVEMMKMMDEARCKSAEKRNSELEEKLKWKEQKKKLNREGMDDEMGTSGSGLGDQERGQGRED